RSTWPFSCVRVVTVGWRWSVGPPTAGWMFVPGHRTVGPWWCSAHGGVGRYHLTRCGHFWVRWSAPTAGTWGCSWPPTGSPTRQCGRPGTPWPWWTGTTWPCGCVARGPRSCPRSTPDRRVRPEGTVVLVGSCPCCAGVLCGQEACRMSGGFSADATTSFCRETVLGKSSREVQHKGLLSVSRQGEKGWGGRRAAPPGGSGSDPDRYGPRPSYSRGRQRQNLPVITVNRDIDRHGENTPLPLNGMIIVG